MQLRTNEEHVQRYFDTTEEAALAHDEQAWEWHGWCSAGVHVCLNRRTVFCCIPRLMELEHIRLPDRS